MKPFYRWLTVLIVLGLLLSACGGTSSTSSHDEPAKVEPIVGTDLNRVTLSERAAERLDIKTEPVRELDVERMLTAGGEVVAVPETEPRHHRDVWVRVPLSEGELNEVALGEPARVFALGSDATGAGLTAQPVDMPPNLGGQASALLYLVADGTELSLAPGQRVRIELPSSSSGTNRLVVPYASVIYGPSGDTWTYTNIGALAFVRHSITIDYIDEQLAVLLDGPPVGTEVVIVGAAELYGTEFGVGK